MNLFKRFKTAVGFAGEMGKTGTVKAAEGLTEILINLDPKNANETQLRLMNEELQKASLVLSTKKIELKKEVDEALQAESEYTKYKKTAVLLNNKIKENPDLEATLGKKLDKAIEKTKDLKDVAKKERAEADAVQELVDILEETIESKFDQIKQAERSLQKVQNNIDKQNAISENMKAKEDLENLTSSTNDFSLALNSMNKKAAKLEAENLSKQRLKDMEKGEDLENDADMKALFDEANGIEPETRASRMADL